MAKKNKMKTKKAIAKRVKMTASGKLKRHSAYRSHLAQSKTTKQKRHSEKARTVSPSDQKRWAGLLQD